MVCLSVSDSLSRACVIPVCGHMLTAANALESLAWRVSWMRVIVCACMCLCVTRCPFSPLLLQLHISAPVFAQLDGSYNCTKCERHTDSKVILFVFVLLAAALRLSYLLVP
jgi:hypothetical protein